MALELIANGDDINYEGAAGPVDFDENGDVVGPIEIWEGRGREDHLHRPVRVTLVTA